MRERLIIASARTPSAQFTPSNVEPALAERLWWRLFKDGDDVFYVHDLDGRFLFVSPAFHRLTGYTEEDVKRITIRDLVSPDDYAANEIRIATAAAGGLGEFPFEMAIRRKDGSIGYGEFAAAVSVGEDGVVRVVGVARDVTARHQAEAQRRDAETFQSTLVEVSLALHAAPTLEALLPMICAAGRRLLGVGGAWLFLVRGDELISAAHDGAPLFANVEQRYRLDGGDPVPGALRAGVPMVATLEGSTPRLLLPLSGRRAPIGVLVFSERERDGGFDEPLRQRAAIFAMQVAVAAENATLVEDLRRADRLKTDFLASVSHDLRTPLNVIVGYTDIHLEGLLGLVNREQYNSLRRVRATAMDLARLINATLDLNRLEAGSVPVEATPVDLTRMWDELLVQFEEHPDSGLVPLRANWDGVPVLLSDPEKLRLILRNLVSNALKFTRRGEVTVSARYDAIAGHLELAVADTGPGITPADLPHIFEMFRQGAAAVQVRGGVGLGLYLVKRVVELLGGSVTVSSEPNVGSTFLVSLPAAAAVQGPR